jgi:hypothetical protein
MSTINYTYNVIVDRFRQFAAGHFQLRRFTHGEISQADLEKEAEWPWLHVKPRAINYSPGTRSFQFEIFISDLPRDKEDKTGYQAESITDCSLIFQDLINEIYLGNMFGSDVVLTRPVSSSPFVEQYTHTLTGVTGTIELNLDYDWSACSIPASWNYNTPTDSGSDGWGALQFIESLDQNGVFVSLLNDEETPGNSYYYGTDASGVKGWYAIVDNIGLTCETLPDCATIISILEDIEALQTDVALKANTADLGATAFSNDYGDLDNLPTIPTSLPPNGAAGGDLTGTYPNPTVHRVHGVDFQSGAPAVDDTWIYVSTPFGSQPFQWQHSKLKTSQVQNDSTVTGTNADDALEHLDSTKVPTTRTLTINGTTQDLSANRTFTIATGLTVGTTPITSGTVGRVLFEGTGNVLQESANFFWDNTNARLGIGTASPAYQLSLSGSANIQGATGLNFLVGTRGIFFGLTGSTEISTYLATSPLIFSLNQGSTPVARFSATNGNLLINTTTDAGYKLDVNGTARVTGALTANTLTLLGNTLFIASATVGGLFATRYTNSVSYSGGHIFTNSTTNISATSGDNFTLQSIQGFAPTSGTANYGALAIAPTINQTGGANGITRGLYVNPTLTAAADFRAIEVTAGTTVLAPSVTARASLRIPSGTAPTSPVNGDIWFDGTNLNVRIAGVTRTIVVL